MLAKYSNNHCKRLISINLLQSWRPRRHVRCASVTGVGALLDRQWLLQDPSAPVSRTKHRLKLYKRFLRIACPQNFEYITTERGTRQRGRGGVAAAAAGPCLESEIVVDCSITAYEYSTKLSDAKFDVSLARIWLLQLDWVQKDGSRFAVLRDDLSHPLLGGNKFRKLDG